MKSVFTDSVMKLAILLPENPNLCDLARARNLADLLLRAKGAGGETVSIVIGVPGVESRARRAVEQYLKTNCSQIVTRPLLWEKVAVSNARRMFLTVDRNLDLAGIETVSIPRDWGWNYTDCDAWLILADPQIGGVLPLRPTGYFCRDLAARIVPTAFASGIHDQYWTKQTEAFRLWRQATFVATSDVDTVDDLVGYAGIRTDKTIILPNLLAESFLEPLPLPQTKAQAICWWLSPSDLHEVDTAIAGFRLYLSEGGRLELQIISELPVHVLRGKLTELLGDTDDLSYILSVPMRHIQSEQMLARTICRCEVLLSTLYAGGDGEAGIAAKFAGVHFVGLDYKVNRTSSQPGPAGGTFYAQSTPEEIATALATAEERLASGSFKNGISGYDEKAVQECGFLIDRFLEVNLA